MASTYEPAHNLPNGDVVQAHQHGCNNEEGRRSILQNLPQNKKIPPQSKTSQEPTVSSTSGSSSLASVSADLHGRVASFLSEEYEPSSILHRVQEQTRISLSVIREALSRYALGELSLSYNGGKDCLVLLILFLTSLHEHHFSSKSSSSPPSTASSSANTNETSETDGSRHTNATTNDSGDTTTTTNSPISSIPAIYARPSHPFQSVESFVTASSQHYHLSLTRYTTNPPTNTMRTAFTSYLDSNPHIHAIFVGTRRTDPHGANLTHFDTTDRGWPDFMRIHPVIDWHYAEIWAFIRHLGVEYCSLYDEGYTSLGGTNDTHPNPMLKVQTTGKDGVAEGTACERSNAYRPAYELMDDDEERLGRD